MDQVAIELAIHQWVVAGTGLASSQVIWEAGQPRPTGTYIAMTHQNERTFGVDWTNQDHNPLVLADDVVESVDAAANTLTLTAHAYVTGDGPIRFTTTNTLPGGLALATDYWLIVVNANTVKVATSRANAVALTAIDITDVGVGVHTIGDTADTVRVGQEIIERARGVRRIDVQFQCFATPAAGASTARAILSKLNARSSLGVVSGILVSAGVGFTGFSDVQQINGVVNSTIFEPRAIAIGQFYLASEQTALSTNITSAELTDLSTGQTFIVP